MTGLLLAARGLEYAYPGGVDALRGLDLSIQRGRKLAILGPNGSGKTTLLWHLNGSCQPTRGQIQLDGQQVRYDRRFLTQWRRRVGLVLQEPDDQLFAATVSQDVSFGPLNLGLSAAETAERVQEALLALRITHLAERPTHALSYGQKKRAAIAGVLAMHPELLVLDEPTAGLDPHGVTHLLGTLQQLHEAGTTLVFSTHDAELAYAWADQVAVFYEGRVLSQGDAAAVLADRALLHQARLRPPLLLEIVEALGLASAQIQPALRSREAVMALLRQRLSQAVGSSTDLAPQSGRATPPGWFSADAPDHPDQSATAQ